MNNNNFITIIPTEIAMIFCDLEAQIEDLEQNGTDSLADLATREEANCALRRCLLRLGEATGCAGEAQRAASVHAYAVSHPDYPESSFCPGIGKEVV